MSYWVTIFDASQWADYELLLLMVAIVILVIWLSVCLFKPQGVMRWTFAVCSCAAISGLCLTSRVDALQLSLLLSKGQNIEVLDGSYRYGRYHFPHNSAYGVDFRDIHIGDRILKLYHSGYLQHPRCYRNFYNTNEFSDNAQLRLYIHWYEHEFRHKEDIIKLKTPCILRIEQRGAEAV
ncbi:hypothetical protein JK628_02060 [Shewanella sp. KX20019]|uniref:hypothetical protein n=1 Tax=Shewanella sp. KX20019 TaxID=2803864 RepID=UPI001925D476|nr:hypothetical protein [Shewanella sp. KX20019]QQX80684.1 hypothetical protein JK628_02060 [Shewanella sp. KX20019]